MRRTTLVILTLVALVSAAHAEDRTYFGFDIGVTNAPLAPRVELNAEPRLVLIGQTRVQAVADGNFEWDLFRYGGAWYLYARGYWYRSATNAGPYRVVDVRVVPTVVLRVPPERWRNHPNGGPPGLVKARGAQVAASGASGTGRDKR